MQNLVLGGVVAWVVFIAAVTLANRESRRRRTEERYRLMLGHSYLLPGIALGIVAFSLLIGGLVWLDTQIDPDSLPPDWVFVVVAIGLVALFLTMLVMATHTIPWLLSLNVIELDAQGIRIGGRLTGNTHFQAPWVALTVESECYWSKYTNTKGETYTRYHQYYILTSGGETVRIRMDGKASDDCTEKHPFGGMDAYFIHFVWDQALFREMIESKPANRKS